MTEPALLAPFERIRTGAIEAALEAVVTVDDRQRIVMINPAALRMFGCAAADVLGRDVACFIPERLRTNHARHIREFDQSNAAELPRRARRGMVGLRANGEEFPIEAAVSRVDAESALGPQRYFTVLMRDLTGQKALEDALESVSRQMRTIFNLAPIAIWITDADRIVFANLACEALFGVNDRAALVGRSIFELLDPSSHEAVRAQIERALSPGAPATIVRERINALTGTLRDVDIALAALPDHGSTTLQMVIADVTEQRREQEAQAQRRHELRRLAAGLVDAREDERRRIARELHDEMGQWLTVLKMELTGLVEDDPKEPLQRRVDKLGEMVDEVVLAVRRIAADLRPMMLDDLGLNAAVDWLARESARRIGIEISVTLDETDPAIDDAATIALYRMTQEALTNIARHAKATRAHITLAQADGKVTLRVTDNGVGFPAPQHGRANALGLIGIRERAYMVDGELETGNLPEGGAFVRVSVPVQSDPACD